MNLDYDIVDKKAVPEPQYPDATTTSLRSLISTLNIESALKLRCKNHGDAKSMQMAAHSAAAYIRRTTEQSFSLRTEMIEEELSEAQQEKYQKSASKGFFPRICHVYVWKEKNVAKVIIE